MLENFTDTQLEQELSRRKREKAEKPRQLIDVDLTALRAACQASIDSLADHGYDDDDSETYISEAAMTTIFGPDVFKWMRERMAL